MLTKRIKIQIVVFVLLALVGTSYLGTRYVGLDVFGSGYSVTVDLPASGGAFDNGEVTYRGVPVGRVKDLRATPTGVTAQLKIESGAPKIPSDVTPKVANRSAIGEQYIDLQGGAASADGLAGGDVIKAGESSQPPPVDDVLRAGADFVDSVPEKKLSSLIDEGYDATQGASEDFGTLLSTSQRFQRAADRNFVATKGLIENSDRVLTTQEDSSASIRSFSSDLDTIATTLKSSDGDLRNLIDSSPAAARELDSLFRQVGQPLGTLLGNLVTPAQVFGVNSDGVEDALIRLPGAVSVGWSVVGSRGINLGLTPTFFNPEPCTTGYGGTRPRKGLDTSRGQSFNLDAGCRSPSAASNVRGPKALPSQYRPARTTNGGVAAADVRTADSLADLMGGGR